MIGVGVCAPAEYKYSARLPFGKVLYIDAVLPPDAPPQIVKVVMLL